MPGFPDHTTLSDKEIKDRVRLLSRELKEAFDPVRYKDPKSFEDAISMASWDLQGSIRKLMDAFRFTMRVRWYESAKRMDLSELGTKQPSKRKKTSSQKESYWRG